MRTDAMRRASLRAVSAALLLAVGIGVLAAESSLSQDTDLRADRYGDAPVLRRLSAGTPVQVLRNEAGWSEVRIDGRTGWVRAGALGGEGAVAAPAARLETGRKAIGNLAVVAGIRAVPRPDRYALIVAVGDYEPSIAPMLAGADRDIESATHVSLALGVPQANVRVLRDRDALAERVRDELAAIGDRVGAESMVYLHLSGQGTRTPDTATAGCRDAWLSAEGRPVHAGELAGWLKPVAARADRLVVFIDTGRGAPPPLPARRGGLVSRYVEPPAAALSGACAQGTGTAAAQVDLADDLFAMGVPAPNLVVLRSASAGQTSWEDPVTGGWASDAFSACFGDRAASPNSAGTGTGTVTIAQILQCAQRRLDERTTARQLPAARLSLTGNARMIAVTPAPDERATGDPAGTRAPAAGPTRP